MPDRDDVQRAILPIPDRPHVGLVTYDAKDPNTSYPPITPLRPPAGAPNVLIVLVDDVGFGASSTFGGPCETPNFERLAGNGLRYNRFHTTALCAPTRAAMLTGRNHHSVGMGGITETATSAPGNSSLRPNTKAPLAETLRLNGYSTAQFGKCHEVPVWQASPVGPFAYDGGGPAKGGDLTLYYDGAKVGEGRVDATQPFIFSADEGVDVGRETGTTVAPECTVDGSTFTGDIHWVELKVGADDHSHQLDPEEHVHVLMARQ